MVSERTNTFVSVDGEPDDITIHNPTMFRMEQMSKGSWWIAVYQGDERISMFMNSKKRITCNVAEDDLEWEDGKRHE